MLAFYKKTSVNLKCGPFNFSSTLFYYFRFFFSQFLLRVSLPYNNACTAIPPSHSHLPRTPQFLVLSTPSRPVFCARSSILVLRRIACFVFYSVVVVVVVVCSALRYLQRVPTTMLRHVEVSYSPLLTQVSGGRIFFFVDRCFTGLPRNSAATAVAAPFACPGIAVARANSGSLHPSRGPFEFR